MRQHARDHPVAWRAPEIERVALHLREPPFRSPTTTMTPAAPNPPRTPLRLPSRAIFGCVSFAIGGPLVAALIWPAVMLVAWSAIDGPSWDTLKLCGQMILLVFFGSFFFGYFLPSAFAGGILAAIGARVRRRWFVLLGMGVGTASMVGYVLLRNGLLDIADGFAGIDVIATADAFITSGVLSAWLHRRLVRRDTARDASHALPAARESVDVPG
ncbi:hypothetical protein [Burkholderia stagnalis]|uniref:hypothetical protein n=2 Tax=Burkholderia stagnalis TaxID=1503054 RepID=UPI001E3F53F4|nr:hypothetical protein [Burkholderia stagnalis]